MKQGLILLLVIGCAVTAYAWRLSVSDEADIAYTTDTLGLDTIVGDVHISNTLDLYGGAFGWATIGAPSNNLHGYSLADSATVRLVTGHDQVTDVLAADSGAIPLTFVFSVPNTDDTLFKQRFWFQYEIWDTVTDTTFSRSHKFRYEFEAR